MVVPGLETRYRGRIAVGEKQSPCCVERRTAGQLARPRSREATLRVSVRAEGG